jgi:hypothetical protein
MKISALVALLAISGASAYSTPSRRDIRNLGQKSFTSAGARRQVGSSIKMEGKIFRALELLRIIEFKLCAKKISTVSMANLTV